LRYKRSWQFLSPVFSTCLPSTTQSEPNTMRTLVSAVLSVFTFYTYTFATQAAEPTESAEKSVDLSKCAGIAAPMQRLKCYDKLSGRLSSTNASKIPTSRPEHWRSVQKTNPIDDTPIITIYTYAIGGQNRFGRKSQLIFRCQNNKTEVLILWHEFIGLGRHASSQKVVIRLDSGTAQSQSWSHSTSGTATFAHRPISLIRKWTKHTRLVAQTTPYNRGPIAAIFNITGLNEAIKPLAKTCNWLLSP